MKTCFKCGTAKPRTQFYKHAKMADGLLGKCKECTKKNAIEVRRANIEYYRSYDRARGNRQTKAYQDKHRQLKPQAYKARSMVSNSVRDGKITRDVLCQFCGSYGNIHAHHRDYSRPLDVQWLCVPCHKGVHVKYGEGLNAI